MGENSKIEWTDATWTPIRARNKATGKVGWHCEHASPGCANCYSESFNAKRLGTGLPFKPGHRGDVEHFLDEAMLLAPLRWRRPRRIFVCSMTDLFGDWVEDAWIDRVFAVMALCPQHTFQVPTKRSARMRAYLNRPAGDGKQDVRNHLAWIATADVMNLWAPGWGSEGIDGRHRSRGIQAFTAWPLPNVWLGVSAEDQRRADERVPDLLATPAAVRFVSAEPLLGPIDFTQIDDGAAHREVPREEWGSLDSEDSPPSLWWNSLTGERTIMHGGLDGNWSRTDAALDLIIVGGESGPGARPMHPDWVRPIRDQCVPAGVAFFFKQWGEWHTAAYKMSSGLPVFRQFSDFQHWVNKASTWVQGGICLDSTGRQLHNGADFMRARDEGTFPVTIMHRVGKKASGRLLDGIEHNGFPPLSPTEATGSSGTAHPDPAPVGAGRP